MTQRRIEALDAIDQTRVCIDCKKDFLLTAGAQTFFASHDLSQPRRCQSCRRLRREERERRARETHEPRGRSGGPGLFDSLPSAGA